MKYPPTSQTSTGGQPLVGVVIPAYREGKNIADLITAIFRDLPHAQVIVVDDSPDDLTRQAVCSLNFYTEPQPRLHYQHRPFKDGRGSAVLDGLKYLREVGCQVMVEMDADFSHPPEQIKELIKLRESSQADLVIAARYLPQSKILNWTLSRRVFSGCANRLSSFVFGIPISDYTNGFRCYSTRAVRVILDNCGKVGKGFISLSEILVTLHAYGYKIVETPTVFTNRVRGESSLNLTEINNAIQGLFQIKRLQTSLKRELSKNSSSSTVLQGGIHE